MKYNIKKHQLGGTVLNSRVVSGLKNKDGRIGWDSNFNITQPNKQAVLLPNITVTPSTSNANLQEEVNTWNKKPTLNCAGFFCLITLSYVNYLLYKEHLELMDQSFSHKVYMVYMDRIH